MIKKANWMERETISLADLCDTINTALANNPKMSLADFAKNLDKGCKAETLRRLEAVEREQFSVGGGVMYED